MPVLQTRSGIFLIFALVCFLLHVTVNGSLHLSCRWYFGKIKRIEAEKKLLLPENEHGAFLIRDSESRRNDYSLSGKCIVNIDMTLRMYIDIYVCKQTQWAVSMSISMTLNVQWEDGPCGAVFNLFGQLDKPCFDTDILLVYIITILSWSG